MDKNKTGALKRNINGALYLARVCFLLNILFCTGAAGLIISKVFFGYEPDLRIYLWIVSSLAGISLAGGMIAAWRSFYSYSDAALILDYYGSYRHIFWIASSIPSEQGSDWLKRMEHKGAAPPRISPRWDLLGKKLLPALLLCAAALFVPVNKHAIIQPYFTSVTDEELKAKEKMAVELKKAGALSQKDLEKIRKEIEEVQSRKSRRFSHERWEAIDGIGERMLVKAEENLALKNWAGSAAKELEKQLGGKERSVSQLAKKTKELEKALKTLAKQGMLTNLPPRLESVLGKDGCRMLNKNFKFDPKSMNAEQVLKDLDQFINNSMSQDDLIKYLKTVPEQSYRLSKKPGGG